MLRKESKLTLNYSKCVFATRTVDLCGYRISRGFVQPDPERIKTQLTLLTLEKLKKQQRSIELLVYHPQWGYSDKFNLTIQSSTFPLEHEARASFKTPKEELI